MREEDGFLTRNCINVSGRLAPRNEDNIALTDIGVVVLKKEEVVDAVVA